MKLIATSLTIMLTMAIVGCATKKPATLAVQPIDSMDSNAQLTLANAHAFIKGFVDNASAKQVVFTTAQMNAIGKISTAYNTANNQWADYHNKKTTDPAELSRSVDNLNATIIAYRPMLKGKTKVPKYKPIA